MSVRLCTAANNVGPRVCGLMWPLDKLQPVAAATYAVLAIVLWALHLPLMVGTTGVTVTSNTFQIVAGSLLSIWLFLSIVSYIVAATMPAHTPAMDNRLLKRLGEDGKPVAGYNGIDCTGNSVPPVVAVPQAQVKEAERLNPDTRLCNICQVYQSPWTKHCYWCDMCVDGYDHHCRWLNHCVGDRNYKYFVIFVSNTLCLVILQWAVGMYYLVEIGRDFHGAFSRRVHAAYGVDAGNVHSPRAAAFFIVLFLLCDTLIACLLGHLNITHIYLQLTRRTTYMYIIEGREKENDKKIADHERDKINNKNHSNDAGHTVVVPSSPADADSFSSHHPHDDDTRNSTIPARGVQDGAPVPPPPLLYAANNDRQNSLSYSAHNPNGSIHSSAHNSAYTHIYTSDPKQNSDIDDTRIRNSLLQLYAAQTPPPQLPPHYQTPQPYYYQQPQTDPHHLYSHRPIPHRAEFNGIALSDI